MVESFIPTPVVTGPVGSKLKSYQSVDGGGNTVQSEGVVLEDGTGNELLGQQLAADSLPVVLATDQTPIEVTSAPSTLELGAETAVTDPAGILLAANPLRTSAIVQNTGGANIRVGPPGVTATTGVRLIPNAVVEYGEPNVYQGEIWAIREGGSDSVAFAQEEQA